MLGPDETKMYWNLNDACFEIKLHKIMRGCFWIKSLLSQQANAFPPPVIQVSVGEWVNPHLMKGIWGLKNHLPFPKTNSFAPKNNGFQ